MANEYALSIKAYLKKRKVAQLSAIMELFPNRSRCSIIRDITSINYLTSYNHAGRYYTLADTPDFDMDGIWFYEEAFFSSHGSLRDTVKYIVENSKDGRTHDELQQRLGVRVQNTLLSLMPKAALVREKHMGAYVYFSGDNGIRTAQMEKRKSCITPDIDPYITIEVLRTVIKHPQEQADAIFRVLSKSSGRISLQLVESIFNRYDLGKKNSQ